MNQRDSEPAAAWHSPERAWTPLMWIIGAVALGLSAMVLAPLATVVSMASSGSSAAGAIEPNVALVDAAKALADWSAAPPPAASAASVDRVATGGVPVLAH